MRGTCPRTVPDVNVLWALGAPWKLFTDWLLGDSMTHCQLPLCGQPTVIYHLAHWIKTDRILRKNYGVLYFSKEALT